MNEIVQKVRSVDVKRLAAVGLACFLEGSAAIACTSVTPNSSYEVRPLPNANDFNSFVKDRFFFKANPEIAQEVISKTHTMVVYSRSGSTFYFYLPENAPVPNQEHLDKMWQFVQQKAIDFPLKRFDPPKEAHFFLGNYGQVISATSLNSLDYQDLNVLVNLQNSDKQNDPLAVEYCQSLLLPASTDMLKVIQQEHDCNTFGIAMYGVENNLNYQEYFAIATRTGPVGGALRVSITIAPYSEKDYTKLQELFGKPKPTLTPTPQGKQKENTISLFASLQEYLAKTGKSFEELTVKDANEISGLSDYLKEIYARFIRGDMKMALGYAKSAIQDKAYVSVISEKPKMVLPDQDISNFTPQIRQPVPLLRPENKRIPPFPKIPPKKLRI